MREKEMYNLEVTLLSKVAMLFVECSVPYCAEVC